MKTGIVYTPRPVGTMGIRVDALLIGEYGRIVKTYDGANIGDIVLRGPGTTILLNNPTHVWSDDTPFPMPYVEKLNAGDKLEIMVGVDAKFMEEIKQLRSYNKINAIKRVREVTNWELKVAKDYVESL